MVENQIIQGGLNNCRKDFPMLTQKMGQHELVYFDNSATTLKPTSVINAITDYYQKYSLNIRRGDYALSHSLEEMVNNCRKKIASFINATSIDEVIFTQGATASLNMIAYGLAHKIKAEDIILSTQLEHASSILPWFRVAEQKNAHVHFLPITEGNVKPDDVEDFLTNHPRTKILAITHVSNVLGNRIPLKEIIKIAHKHGVLVIADCTQSVPHQKIDVQDLDVDFIVFSAHKMLGPTGIGILYGKKELLQDFSPLFLGGGSNARFDSSCAYQMKDGFAKFESGTQHLAGILGFSAAIDYLNNLGLENIHNYEKDLMNYFLTKVKKYEHLIEAYHWETPTGIFTFNCKGIFAQDAAQYFSARGIALRAGHHCAKMSKEVLNVAETLRMSLYIYNTYEEIDYFINCLSEITLEKCIDIYL